ncbi:hypothetical protein B0I63_003991 [Clostridium beijerinckii]|uniref:Uncharacterized protein n=1 Tax=Clostridium beijerinckii TaxID=1520 RepID=A0A9Q5GJK9_CLOBE|nr:hypothetical protein [Clostridium beijerinckii]MBA2900579.1 hypothetical protein [Clostridium beijerinckii]MBA2910279.1 hypothetical protein [Clostridium beijerinckii]MBA9014037.1 hypothetical protein [Clostridium beijerinckii]NRT03537.1 hypothetical protein [Clostridium beijerinckii]
MKKSTIKESIGDSNDSDWTISACAFMMLRSIERV